MTGDPAAPAQLHGGDSAALERLVQRALAESLHPAARGAPRSEVVLAATARLERLLENFGHLDGLRSRLAEQRKEITAELSRLRGAVVARRGFLETDGDASVWPVDPERWRTLRWRVQARLAALVDGASGAEKAAEKGADKGAGSEAGTAAGYIPAAGLAGAARVTAQEIMDLFAKERAASLAEMRRRSDADVLQLERRLQALAVTVEQAEQVLEVLRETPIEGRGVASYYRGHEGLGPDAKQREMKLAMLDGLYRQNVELRREPES